MEKSIEDYRRELMDMAARGNSGARELFAEDSEVETTPPQMSSPPTLPQEMEPQPTPQRPAPPQIQPVPPQTLPQRPTPQRPIEPQPAPQRPTQPRPTPPRPTPPRPTPPRPTPPRPTPPRPESPMPTPPPQMAPAPSRPIPPINAPNLTASGTLVVVLTHSKGLFPVPNARVCVSDTNGNSIGCKQTDESGRTEEWRLPAPPKANSASPGASASDVSAFYNLRIDAEGYVPVIIEGVPIFDGVRTLQPLDMFFAGAADSTAPEVIKFNNSYTL